jgi:hypothetical protein
MAERKEEKPVYHTIAQQNGAGRIVSIKINELEFLEGSVYSIRQRPDKATLSFRIRHIFHRRGSGYRVACEVIPRRRTELYVCFYATELYDYYVH